MKLNNDLVNRLIEKAKSEKLLFSLICLAFVLFGGIKLSDKWFVDFGRLLIADCFSIAILYGYKIRCNKFKEQKYKNYRYKKILWDLILTKTLIFVPFVYWILSKGCWFLFKISVFRFNYLEYLVLFVISWLIWCAILLIVRKIYKKIRNNNSPKLPSSFYDGK